MNAQPRRTSAPFRALGAGALAALVASCAPRGAPLECDPTSTELAVGYQVLTTVHVAPHPVLFENGRRFLFVGADCRFWAFDASVAATLGWSEVRVGVLTEAELAEMNDGFLTAPWPGGDVRLGETMVGHLIAVWRSGGPQSGCSGSCPDASGELLALHRAAESWLARLYARGVPADGPMRVAAFSDSDAALDRPVAYDGEIDLAALPHTFETLGGNLEVTSPEETSRLRALRVDFLEGRIGIGVVGYVALEQDGAYHRVWFRDAVPHEDARGLIRPPM